MSTRGLDWTLQLAKLRRELGQALAAVSELRAVSQRREELERLLLDLDHQLERIQGSAIILLVGSTGAGKSSLLNALVGTQVAREGVSRPTTQTATIYAPLDADLNPLLEGLLGPAPCVVRYNQKDSRGSWTEQVLIDAPDVNSIATEHRETVRALAERADVLVLVMHRQSVVEQSAVSFVRDFKERRRILFVLNRADELTDQARGELIAQVHGLARKELDSAGSEVFAVSAKRAQEGLGGAAWQALLTQLERFVREEALLGVRRTNAIGAANAFAQLIDTVHAATREDLEALPLELRTGLANLLERTQAEVGQRLTLRRSELVNGLVTEAARRWDGPGGWSLRVGTWSALGTGLGLSLVRRNPLIAAGLALGGTALGAVRRAQGREQLENALGLLPEAGELRQWYGEQLGSARLRAGRLSGDPKQLELPEVEALYAELESAIGEAWNRLLHRSLPEAVVKSAPTWLRWTLDLPIYALLGWILWRAAEGFVSGRYVGLDFLLNGLLMALALLCLLRLAVRAVVARQAQALIQETRGRARVRLEQSMDDLLRPAETRCAALSNSLAELSQAGERWKKELSI